MRSDPDTLLDVSGRAATKGLLMRSVHPLRVVSTAMVVAAGSTLAVSGCADNDSSLFIAGVLGEASNTCTFEPDGDAVTRGSGTIDVSLTQTYTMPLLLGNQLVARGDEDKLRTETSRIVIRGAVVTVLDVKTNATLANFSTNANGFVNPSSGTTPGYGVSFVTAVPSSLGQQLDSSLTLGQFKELNVAVSVYGDTLGGQEIESATLTYPLFACKGCLVDCSTASPIDGSCLSFPEDDLSVSCFIGQDTFAPCQFSNDPDNICR